MVVYGALMVFFVWCVILTVIIYSTQKHYLKLVSKTGKERIDEILNQILSNEEKKKEEVKRLGVVLARLEEKEQFHLQKTALLRFNPFERTGGEQSFVLALLDKKNSGLIVNFIYTRDGLRAYAKRVKNGEGEEYQLSREEKRAIEQSK